LFKERQREASPLLYNQFPPYEGRGKGGGLINIKRGVLEGLCPSIETNFPFPLIRGRGKRG